MGILGGEGYTLESAGYGIREGVSIGDHESGDNGNVIGWKDGVGRIQV